MTQQFWEKLRQVKEQAQQGNYELWVPYIDDAVQEALRSIGYIVAIQGKGYSIRWFVVASTGDCGSRDSP